MPKRKEVIQPILKKKKKYNPYKLSPEEYFKMFVKWSRESGLNYPALPRKFVEGGDIPTLCIQYGVKLLKVHDHFYYLDCS